MIEDDKFFAWLDGELGLADAAEMEAKVAANPELSRLAERHRALGLQLRGAFSPVATAPVPERLRSALRSPGQVVGFVVAKPARWSPSLAQWAAMAATLALGMFLGTMVSQRANPPIQLEGGGMYAASSLNQALNTQLASAPSGDIRIGLTFRDHKGAICRSFSQRAADGIACRSGGRWQLKGMFAAPEGQTSDYRMAAGMDPNLAALVDSTIAGEPLNAGAEKAERDRGWR